MRESIFMSGSERELVGVLTQPNEDPPPSQPLILLLNAGLIHRVGPFRLHVSLSRRFAEAGFASLRLDLSGIGDSPNLRVGTDELKRAEEDTRFFLDSLTKKLGVSQFLILGLCSGADNAQAIAVRDPRVVGLILLDGYAFANLRYRANYLVSQILNAEKWRYFLSHPKDLFSRIQSKFLRTSEHMETFTRYFPDQDTIRGEQRELIQRKVRSIHIFTGGSYEYFNYQDQFADLFPDYFSSGLPEVIFRPDMDHTYSQCTHREELGRILIDWLIRHFSNRTDTRQTPLSSVLSPS